MSPPRSRGSQGAVLEGDGRSRLARAGTSFRPGGQGLAKSGSYRVALMWIGFLRLLRCDGARVFALQPPDHDAGCDVLLLGETP